MCKHARYHITHTLTDRVLYICAFLLPWGTRDPSSIHVDVINHRSGVHLTVLAAESNDYRRGHHISDENRALIEGYTKGRTQSDDEIRTTDIPMCAPVWTFALIFIVFDTHCLKDKD